MLGEDHPYIAGCRPTTALILRSVGERDARPVAHRDEALAS